MPAPRVSVILTVFNAQPYLREAIDSILAQTLADFELMIIDDCSTDDGWPVIVEAAARDPRITPVRRARQGGASAGLNQCLSSAKGEFVTRQDADDVSRPKRLAEQVAFLDAHGEVGAVGTAATLIDDQGRVISEWRLPQADQDIQRALLERMCFCGPTVMVRRRILEQIRFRFDEALSSSEDYDLCLRVAEVAGMANLAEPLYLYRQHPASVSRSREHEQLARKAAALENALHRRFGSLPAPDLARTAARDFVTAAVMAHLRGQPDKSPEWLERARCLDSRVIEDVDWLAQIVRTAATPLPVSLALARMQSLFADVLPPGHALARLQRSLIAELHLREVFAPAGPPDRARIRQHLWSAVRANPRWLANRGVLSLLVRDILGRPPAESPT